jgi:hypothetical protein
MEDTIENIVRNGLSAYKALDKKKPFYFTRNLNFPNKIKIDTKEFHNKLINMIKNEKRLLTLRDKDTNVDRDVEQKIFVHATNRDGEIAYIITCATASNLTAQGIVMWDFTSVSEEPSRNYDTEIATLFGLASRKNASNEKKEALIRALIEYMG